MYRLLDSERSLISTTPIQRVTCASAVEGCTKLNALDMLLHTGKNSALLVVLGNLDVEFPRRIYLSSIFEEKNTKDPQDNRVVMLTSADNFYESYHDLQEVLYNGLILPQATHLGRVFSVQVASEAVSKEKITKSSLDLFAVAQKHDFQASKLFFLRDLISAKSGLTEDSFASVIQLICSHKTKDPRRCLLELFKVCSDMDTKILADIVRSQTMGSPSALKYFPRELFTPLNVLVVTPEYRGYSIAGGVATMLSDLVKNFRVRGQKVTVLTPLYQVDQ